MKVPNGWLDLAKDRELKALMSRVLHEDLDLDEVRDLLEGEIKGLVGDAQMSWWTEDLPIIGVLPGLGRGFDGKLGI